MKMFLKPSGGQVKLSCSSETAADCIREALEKDVWSDYSYEFAPGRFSHTLLLSSYMWFPGVIKNQVLVFFDTEDGCTMHIVGDTENDAKREEAFIRGNSAGVGRGAFFHPKWIMKIRDELERYIVV